MRATTEAERHSETDYELLQRVAGLHRKAEEGADAVGQLRDLTPRVKAALAGKQGKKIGLWDGDRWREYRVTPGHTLAPYAEPPLLTKADFDRTENKKEAPREPHQQNGCAAAPAGVCEGRCAGGDGPCEEAPPEAPDGGTVLFMFGNLDGLDRPEQLAEQITSLIRSRLKASA